MNGVRRLFTTGSGSSTTTATTTTTQTTNETSVGIHDGNTAWSPIIIGRQTPAKSGQKFEQQGTQLPSSLREHSEQFTISSIPATHPTMSSEFTASSVSSDQQATMKLSLQMGIGAAGVPPKFTSQRSHHNLIMELLASESAIECKDFQKLEPDEIAALKKVRTQTAIGHTASIYRTLGTNTPLIQT
jgi:hypothetical protein